MGSGKCKLRQMVFPCLFQIYMSPEVILCRGHSTKADIYSLGATLIHMQTGTPPWVKRYPRSAYPSYLYIVSEGLPAEFCLLG